MCPLKVKLSYKCRDELCRARLFKGLIVYRLNFAEPDCAGLDSVGPDCAWPDHTCTPLLLKRSPLGLGWLETPLPPTVPLLFGLAWKPSHPKFSSVCFSPVASSLITPIQFGLAWDCLLIWSEESSPSTINSRLVWPDWLVWSSFSQWFDAPSPTILLQSSFVWATNPTPYILIITLLLQCSWRHLQHSCPHKQVVPP